LDQRSLPIPDLGFTHRFSRAVPATMGDYQLSSNIIERSPELYRVTALLNKTKTSI